MLNHDQANAFAAGFPQIAGDRRLLDEVSANAASVHLGRGQSICREGDRCSHLALVTSGAARVFKLAESGREITLYRVEAGECCILTASCILSGRLFPANAAVESGLDAVLVSESHVVRWMGASEPWRQFLWGLLAERLGHVISLVEEVAFRRMDERLGEYLAGQAGERGRTLRATHQQIAADLGTSREVVSRMLKDFEQGGLLRLSRGRIEIDDPEALHDVGRLRD